jgi:hypothetical protein
MVDVTNLEEYPIWYSFCIAMLMGTVHVLFGPDHVSALVLLVAGVKRHEQISDSTNKWQLCKKSAMQGFRWGLGHTIGLTFMTAIFMTFRGEIPMDKVGTVSDYIVGSMMIIIGTASLFSLYKWYQRRQKQLLHLRDVEINYPRLHPNDGCPLAVLSSSDAHIEAHEYNFTHRHTTENEEEPVVTTSNTLWSSFRRWRMGDTFTDSPTSAYVIGCVHGISGLSGVVYVLPALFLDDTVRLILYLLGFAITSIGSMSALGGTLGLVPQGTKNIMLFSGIAGLCALGVGVMWVVFTYLGMLDL